MLVSTSYQNCKIKHLPLRQDGETSGYRQIYTKIHFIQFLIDIEDLNRSYSENAQPI